MSLLDVSGPFSYANNVGSLTGSGNVQLGGNGLDCGFAHTRALQLVLARRHVIQGERAIGHNCGRSGNSDESAFWPDRHAGIGFAKNGRYWRRLFEVGQDSQPGQGVPTTVNSPIGQIVNSHQNIAPALLASLDHRSMQAFKFCFAWMHHAAFRSQRHEVGGAKLGQFFDEKVGR